MIHNDMRVCNAAGFLFLDLYLRMSPSDHHRLTAAVGPFHFTYDGSSCPFTGGSRGVKRCLIHTMNLIRSLTEVLTS